MHQHDIVTTTGSTTEDDLPSNAYKPCSGEIIEPLIEALLQIFFGGFRMLFARLDIRFPTDHPVPPDDQAFVDFMESFVLCLHQQGLDPRYVWAREQFVISGPRYRICLFLDERKGQNISELCTKAEKMWARALGVPGSTGLVRDCTRDPDGHKAPNGLKIPGDGPEFMAHFKCCYYWTSSLLSRKKAQLDKINRSGSSHAPSNDPVLFDGF